MDSASSVLSAFIKGSNEEFVAPRSCGWVGEPVAVMVKRGHARPTNHTSELSTLSNGRVRCRVYPRGTPKQWQEFLGSRKWL